MEGEKEAEKSQKSKYNWVGLGRPLATKVEKSRYDATTQVALLCNNKCPTQQLWVGPSAEKNLNLGESCGT